MTVRHLLSGATLAAAVTMLAASSASAQQGFFNYSTTVAPDPLTSNSGISTIDFIPGSNNTGVNANLGTAIVLTQMQTFSTAGTNSPDAFTNRPLTIGLTITNLGPGGGVLSRNVTGTISGNATQDAAFFTANLNQTPLLFAFSSGTFTVSNFTFLSPGAPGATTNGAIGASVTFQATPQAPEPGSLALAATGLMGAMGMVIRRRRSAK